MASSNPRRLTSPQRFLWRMIVFLLVAAILAAILFTQIRSAFLANPGLNGLILGVLLVGIVYIFRQVLRLYPEISWVNGFRLSDPGIEVARAPVLLAPMATMLRDRVGEMSLSAPAMRSLLDSLAMRLDESREIARYAIGLLVFLGLLGTFWGLLETVSSVSGAINSLDATDTGLLFEELKAGLEAPLSGMGTAFSSSLFGLAGSLVLGFLDLQAGQAQNRFYTGLEDWLSEVTDLTPAELQGHVASTNDRSAVYLIQQSLDQLTRQLTEPKGSTASHAQTAAMGELAEGVQAMVQHMRAEQQLIRSWVEEQASRHEELAKIVAGRLDEGESDTAPPDAPSTNNPVT